MYQFGVLLLGGKGYLFVVFLGNVGPSLGVTTVFFHKFIVVFVARLLAVHFPIFIQGGKGGKHYPAFVFGGCLRQTLVKKAAFFGVLQFEVYLFLQVTGVLLQQRAGFVFGLLGYVGLRGVQNLLLGIVQIATVPGQLLAAFFQNV